MLAGTLWGEVYPAHVLWRVQINVYEYLQALQVGNGTAGEDAPELHCELQRSCFHMVRRLAPFAGLSDHQLGCYTPAGGGGVGTIKTRRTRASTAASATSSLISATPRPTSSSGGAATTQGTHVANTPRDAEFDALQLRPQMRDLLRAHPPPANDARHEFCVSWWGRGGAGCYTNCGRAATHRPVTSASERSRLLAHVRAHLVVAPTATQAGAAAST